MITTQQKTSMQVIEWREVNYKRRGGWLLQWWEQVSANSLGNDIHIDTKNTIDRIILNGKMVYSRLD